MNPVDPALQGTVAIVTGAAQGIGAAIAARLGQDGATVILADINAAGAESYSTQLREQGLSTFPMAVDVASPGSVGQMVDSVMERFGRIDCLINNAALDAPPGLAWDLTPNEWSRVIDVNLSGQWWCTRAVLPAMMAQHRGKIIFISSVSARMGDPDTSVAYNAAKAGLIGLTIGLSVQLEGYGILVNAIAPGPTGTGTPMTVGQRKRTMAVLPLGIQGPQPIAEACLFLARASGDWVSGSVMNVSGGMWRGY